MLKNDTDISELHWMMDMLQTIDVGLVVVDREYQVRVWNRFMQNHSGLPAEKVLGGQLFERFPDIPEAWLRRKADSVFMLRNRAFTTWEQRPYLFRFHNYRPITGSAPFMYQNTTLVPLTSPSGEIDHVGIIIYDVTDTAVGHQDLAAANSELEKLSRTDRLTGLNNRGFWEENLITEFRRYQRTQEHCSLVIFDIDHFKKVNDTYGHQAGDEVIRATAATVLHEVRATDIAGRYGGEEFTVLLIGTPIDGAMIFAERLRQRMESLRVEHEGTVIPFTISLGVAEASPDMETAHVWLECADQSLYKAKQGGRNQAVQHVPEKLKKTASSSG